MKFYRIGHKSYKEELIEFWAGSAHSELAKQIDFFRKSSDFDKTWCTGRV